MNRSDDSAVLDLTFQTASHASIALKDAALALLLPALVFALLALVVKGRRAFQAARRAAAETRINLTFHFFDAVFVAPAVAILIVMIQSAAVASGLPILFADLWFQLPGLMTLLAVLFIGDFVAYWRHRAEHSRLLWPAHAIHHSDTEMTWLALSRFHPVNRFVTAAVDSGVLILLGFPVWALVANNLVRHYYGQFIHADLPWTYGPAGYVFVSPVMHRWHHARKVRGSGSNFATLFSVFDRAFGTHYVPGQCDVPLGVREDMGRGCTGQLLHPFRVWGASLMAAAAAGRARRQ